ncbi:MAG: response regulator [Acidobacteria bacterium]|nr:response regulator [Acidobacteriota bacterium]
MSFRILVVDDDPDVRDLLTRFLKRRGYIVEHACDGEEALAAVREHEPDLMLLDVYLPKMTGLDVLFHMRDEHPDTRTIALSGIPGDQIVQSSKELGAVDFITKPFDFPALTAKIDANLVAGVMA